MNQILQFIQNHWMLVSAFGVVLVVLFFEEIKGKMGGAARVSVQNATLLLNRENGIVIDLRNKQSFDNGHILNAINIARADFDSQFKKIEQHKNDILILVGNNDADVTAITAKLQKHGFTKVYILAGGLQAWKDARLPLTKS